MDFIKLVEEDFQSGKQLPKFAPGDTIVVDYRIKEGNKERIQKFRGTVIRAFVSVVRYQLALSSKLAQRQIKRGIPMRGASLYLLEVRELRKLRNCRRNPDGDGIPGLVMW